MTFKNFISKSLPLPHTNERKRDIGGKKSVDPWLQVEASSTFHEMYSTFINVPTTEIINIISGSSQEVNIVDNATESLENIWRAS